MTIPHSFAIALQYLAVPETAGTDYYAGIAYGWSGADVLFQMRACMPSDKDLANYIDEEMYCNYTCDQGKGNQSEKQQSHKQPILQATLRNSPGILLKNPLEIPL